MKEPKAVYYGKVELIPGIICDGYVLDDGTAVMSLRGTADLLGIDHMILNRVETNWPPKMLKPFIHKGSSVETKLVKVVAKNSPHKGRKIKVYNTSFIESFIRGYALALANDILRPNQIHIGKRSIILQSALVQTALETAIKQACGLNPNIQDTAQKTYADVAKLLKDTGLKCSIAGNIATKKDMVNYFEVPPSTLNSNLRKLQNEIEQIDLDREVIRASGSKATRLYGYSLEDVGKLALNMDSVIGIELKKQIFGDIGTLAKLDTKGEIEWQKVLTQVFAGFSFHHNYTFGSYRADFFVEYLRIILECNGYDNHRYYNKQEEKEREQLLNQNYTIIRFHHQITLEQLFNGILRAKIGKTIKLYEIEPVSPKTLNV